MTALRRRFSGLRTEAGETLLEVLIASTLMAIAVVAILGGLGTMLASSSLHRDQARANTVLVAAMEKVKSDEVTRVSCSTDPYATYLAKARTAPLPTGWASSQIDITTIAYQMPAAGGAVGFSTNRAADCNDARSLQRVTITVTSPDGRVKPSMTFVKGAL
jgi:Tfp pilus assembly protein PilV